MKSSALTCRQMRQVVNLQSFTVSKLRICSAGVNGFFIVKILVTGSRCINMRSNNDGMRLCIGTP